MQVSKWLPLNIYQQIQCKGGGSKKKNSTLFLNKGLFLEISFFMIIHKCN